MSRRFELFRRILATTLTAHRPSTGRPEPQIARRKSRGRTTRAAFAAVLVFALPAAAGAQSWSADKAQ
ncbi:MAG: hypothetical protein WA649_08295, partial [Methylovirgula sp.]